MRYIFFRVLVICLTLLLFVSANAQLIFTKAGGNSGIGNYFPATEAGLADPVATAVDSKGNVFIAERWGNRIRRVDAGTSIITTFAGKGLPSDFAGDGGPALNAVFYLPVGIVTDRAGHLYIADEGNFRIRKVDVVSGVITTIAGNGSEGFTGDGGPAINASMSTPHALAVDRNDNIYFVDKANHRIRKITKATGIISTVAGNGSSIYAGDGGPATNASFGGLAGVAVDSAGNIYLADASNRIRKVDAATGTISTIAGNGADESGGDGGPATTASFGINAVVQTEAVAVDESGNVYIADGRNGRVRKVDAVSGIITTIAGKGSVGYHGDGGPATDAVLTYMSSVSVDKKGNVFINDRSRHTIRKIDAATGIINTIAGNGKSYYLGDGKKAKEIAIGPNKLAFDNSGGLIVADANAHRIRRIDALTDIVTTVAGTGEGSGYSREGGPAIDAVVDSPDGIAIDKEGNLYIIVNQRRIRKVSAATGIISHFAGDSTWMGYSGDGGPASKAAFNGPRDLTFDDKGNLFIADAGSHTIRRIDAGTGIVATVAGTGLFGFSSDGGLATATKLTWPTGVAVDKAGNLYIAESYNHRIRKVDAVTGIISTVAGTGSKGFFGDGRLATEAWLNSPGDVTLDANGDLYIVDSDNHRIRKVDAATGVISTIAGKGAAGFSGDGELATVASLNYPTDVAIDKEGKIYIADSYNYRIRYICKTATLPSATIAGVSTIDPQQNNTAVFAENCILQATLQPAGTNPVSGIVYDSVWVEPTVPIVNGQPYVQRHYGITPQQNASTATGTLTLYFTQAEFTAYNAVPDHGPDLPIDAVDAANNKANLRIRKRSGSSGDGTGRFDAYSGDTTDITPASVVWDNSLNAWKVTFEVKGFSGFFAHSASVTPPGPLPNLPFTLVHFTVRQQDKDAVLIWETTNEKDMLTYEIERSVDKGAFSKVGSSTARNSTRNNYSFTDKDIVSFMPAELAYRLRIVKNNHSSYSDTVSLKWLTIESLVLFFPNPVSETPTLQIESLTDEILDCKIIDISGRAISHWRLNVLKGRNSVPVSVNMLASGTYLLQLKGIATSRLIRFTKP